MTARATTSTHQPGCRYRSYRLEPSQPLERDKNGRFLRGGHDCGGTFVCPGCGRTVGWCYGCDDKDEDLAELCDDCWAKATEGKN
jgi:hypothetical protein